MAKKRKLPYLPVEYQPPEEQQIQEQIQQQYEEQEEQKQLEYEEQEEEDQNPEEEEQQEDKEEEQQEDKEEEQQEDKEEEQQEDKEEEDEPIEKLLEPLQKDQLLLLVKEAISIYPDLIDSVNNLADADPAHRKIFVHGLGWDTTAETLVSEFSKYGEIEDCKNVVDKVSGKSKGYAFILFKKRVGAKRALKESQKSIGNRNVSCQLASEGPVQAPVAKAASFKSRAGSGPPVSEYTQRKIFVSNVGADVDPQKLVEFFSQFGEIEEGPLGIDKHSGKFKGFCLFVYRSVDGTRKALEEPHKPFEGTTLHCKKAVDGPKHSKPLMHSPHQQHHNGFRKEKRPYGGGHGHMMAPSGPSMGFSQTPDLAPVIGQALTALLANQGAAGIGNLLGGLGGAQQGMSNQGYNQGYNQQYGGGYGAPQQGAQGGYQNQQMGGAPYNGYNR